MTSPGLRCFALIVSLFSMGCSSLVSGALGGTSAPPKTYLALDLPAREESTQEQGRVRAPTIAVQPALGELWLDSQRIYYTKGGGEFDYYRYSVWIESPVVQMRRALGEALRSADPKLEVLEGSSAVTSEYILDWRLLELVHDAQSQPGSVRMALRVELTKRAGRELIASNLFRASDECNVYSAVGAVETMSIIARRLLDDVSHWVIARINARAVYGQLGQPNAEPSGGGEQGSATRVAD